ncbi:MAG: mechanosensitive ion channel protein MscS [Ignavibacteriae bacterium HGW-Ignavibacteriae-2]|jgi:small-conductance mechanosensitive channel|nr:MAG: mechanosensitive ion channel protein MscS [Ignavibacteriae bacterium HGW-Ignavibacteriae-2]
MQNLMEKYLGIGPELQSQLLYTVIILIVLWLFRKLIVKYIVDRLENQKERYQWTKTTKTITLIITLILLSRVWFGFFDQVGTFLGLLSAGIAIALKDLLVNLTGWVFILIRKPFKIGDRIQIDGVIGDVIDLRLFQFSVVEVGNWVDADQSTGRIIHIPNGMVYIKWQANYTAGFEYIWNEIPVLITFESNWKTAKNILNEAVKIHSINLTPEAEKQIKEASKKYMIIFNKLDPIVYTSVRDSGILLTIRYICHARRRRATEEKIWEEILVQFAKYDNIDFAYPTTRFYNNKNEGKGST